MIKHIPERIYKEQAVKLYCESSLHNLAAAASDITSYLHPKPLRTYVIERNINYTNVCITRCSFCSFSTPPTHPNAYTLNYDEIWQKVTHLTNLGGRQILMQGGMNPKIELKWYINLLKQLKNDFPGLHIHAFSPPEIAFFAQKFNKTTQKILSILHESGLDSLPGGGAEILSDRVRKLVSPAKCSAREWLNIMEQAHEMGMSSTATMMFGHLETARERIEHLDKLRNLQEESLKRREKTGFGGIFTAFTCWPFQPGNTRLSKRYNRYKSDNRNNRHNRNNPDNADSRDSPQLRLAGALGYLRMTAMARIYLDNIANIQASWVTQGPEIAQLSLIMGCNDAGSLMMEENVVSAAGTTYRVKLEQLKDLIRMSGFEPQQRNYYYEPIS